MNDDQLPLFDIAQHDRVNITRKHFAKAALLLPVVGTANAQDVPTFKSEVLERMIPGTNIPFESEHEYERRERVHAVIKARANDVHTSHDAAASMHATASEHRKLVLQCIRNNGAQTAHEIAAALGTLNSVQVTRRLSELHDQGLIQRKVICTDPAFLRPKQTVEYQTRNSPAGRPCAVWYVTPKGQTD